MKATTNNSAMTIKWAVITPVGDGGFCSTYQNALKSAGFMLIGKDNDVAVHHYLSTNENSVNRYNKMIEKLNTKISSLKRRTHALLAFTITDKQFGLIGNVDKSKFAKCKVPTSVGIIPVTRMQMFGNGRIELPGVQGTL